MNRYIVVSGIPASGKSTLAAALAAKMRLPLFDKDHFLEARFAAGFPSDPAERRRSSRSADRELEDAVRKSSGAVAVSWWRHPKSTEDSGTPTDWLRELSSAVVEVYCRCPPREAVARFLERERHPGHLDGRWSYDELVAQFEQAALLGPIGLGQVVEVETSQAPAVAILYRRLQHAFTIGERIVAKPAV